MKPGAKPRPMRHCDVERAWGREPPTACAGAVEDLGGALEVRRSAPFGPRPGRAALAYARFGRCRLCGELFQLGGARRSAADPAMRTCYHWSGRRKKT